MRIVLQTLSGERHSSIELDAWSTLADLRQAINELEAPSPRSSLSLVLGVHMLQDDSSDEPLENYGISDGCMLTLIKRKTVLVLTSSNDRTAKVWNAVTGECILTLSGNVGDVNSAAFSPDWTQF